MKKLMEQTNNKLESTPNTPGPSIPNEKPEPEDVEDDEDDYEQVLSLKPLAEDRDAIKWAGLM